MDFSQVLYLIYFRNVIRKVSILCRDHKTNERMNLLVYLNFRTFTNLPFNEICEGPSNWLHSYVLYTLKLVVASYLKFCFE